MADRKTNIDFKKVIYGFILILEKLLIILLIFKKTLSKSRGETVVYVKFIDHRDPTHLQRNLLLGKKIIYYNPS